MKVIDIDEKDDKKVKEYVIKDNLLRRHMTTEQKLFLYAELSIVYETGRGGDRKSQDFKKDIMSSMKEQEDVNAKTADLFAVIFFFFHFCFFLRNFRPSSDNL